MIQFKEGEQRLIRPDQRVLLKLALPNFKNIAYYENHWENGWCSRDGSLWRKDTQFLGYLEEKRHWIGLGDDHQSYIPVHKFRQNWSWWDQETTDQDLWILMFMGNDDISYYMIFLNETTLDEYFAQMIYFEENEDMIILN